jgi:heparan-alpha-glucosaminide N-acetyltransferase
MFMQGVSLAISFASERKRGASKADLATKVVIRAAKLYALGLFINSQGSSLDQWRVIGVLQYFGVSYFIIGMLETFVRPAGEGKDGKNANEDEEVPPPTLAASLWRDLGRYWAQWFVMAELALLYFGLQAWLPVDGCPSG